MLMAWQGLTSYGYPLAIPGFDPVSTMWSRRPPR